MREKTLRAVQAFEHEPRRKHLWPYLDVAVCPMVNVKRNAAAPELLQVLSDPRVLIRPVSLQKRNM